MKKSDWTSDIKNAKHLKAVDLDNWILFYGPRDENVAFEFFEKLRGIAGAMGILVREPQA